MTTIIVDPGSLNSYSSSLSSKAKRFYNLVKEMDDIVTSISQSWSGEDSRKFISNATSYLNNLRRVETTLLRFSGSVKNHSSHYSKRIEDFYSRLG
jgi:uncharacterized protein YukE